MIRKGRDFCLRVCIISQYSPPDIGGASTRVSNSIKGLKKRGHKIVVVTAFPHYPHGRIHREYRRRVFAIEENDGVKVIRVWVPPLPHEGFAKRLVMYLSFTLSSLMGLLFCGKVDVVWAVSPNYFVSFSGILYKIVKRSPLVLDVVDLWPEAVVNLGFLKSKLIIKAVGLSVSVFYRLSDAIVTLNSGMRSEILKRERDSSKIFIVENVADLDVFRSLDVERELWQGKFVVMYSGNLGLMYDFDAVLRAARSLSCFEDVVFVLRGDGECKGQIKEELKRLELENVFLLTNVVDVKRVVKFLNMADVLLLPMKKLEESEVSFPLKLIEYLSCGKPVICCAEGETAKIVYKSGAGFVVEPGNSKELSDAILRLYKNRRYYEALGRNGRKFVLKRFSCQQMGKKLENVFHSSCILSGFTKG